jgi:hypothetical protein
MEFVLIDVGATLALLLGYLTVVIWNDLTGNAT